MKNYSAQKGRDVKLLEYQDESASRISTHEQRIVFEVLAPEIERVAQALSHAYATEYAAINLPTDTALHDHIASVIVQKRSLRPTMMIVVGIGGSDLGIRAVHYAINGILYNETLPDMRLYFVDTTDTDTIVSVSKLMTKELQNNHAIIVTIISKSGTTTETIANADILLALLHTYAPERAHEYVVVITDRNSSLAAYAFEKRYTLLEIPTHVGGRYSVLSAVGLFPLGMIGIDIKQLCAGAAAMRDACISYDIEQNNAALKAILMYAHYHDDIRIHNMFLFDPSLESLGKWYRQLLAESIGKEYNRSEQVVHAGILPTVSVGSTDLHSVGQLYLAGPHDAFTTFIIANPRTSASMVGYDKQLTTLIPHIAGKSLEKITRAIAYGTQRAYRIQNLPFITLEIPEKSAWFIGQFLQASIMEIIYLGYLLDVNPFDQPQVELYKHETREILAHE